MFSSPKLSRRYLALVGLACACGSAPNATSSSSAAESGTGTTGVESGATADESGEDTSSTTGPVELPPVCQRIESAVEFGIVLPSEGYEVGSSTEGCIITEVTSGPDGEGALFECPFGGPYNVWASAADGSQVFPPGVEVGADLRLSIDIEISSSGCGHTIVTMSDSVGRLYRSVDTGTGCLQSLDQTLDSVGLDLDVDREACPLSLVQPQTAHGCGQHLPVGFHLRAEQAGGWQELESLPPDERRRRVETVEGTYDLWVGESFHRPCMGLHTQPVFARVLMVRQDSP